MSSDDERSCRECKNAVVRPFFGHIDATIEGTPRGLRLILLDSTRRKRNYRVGPVRCRRARWRYSDFKSPLCGTELSYATLKSFNRSPTLGIRARHCPDYEDMRDEREDSVFE